MPISRPRVRTADGEDEISPESYTAFAEADLMADHMIGAMLAGVSTRRYDAALEPVDEQTEERASSTVEVVVIAQVRAGHH